MILRRRDPEQHMARFYRVALQARLFGGWNLVREWGSIGSPGTVRALDAFATEDEARAARDSMIERKRRRGYR